MAHDPLDPIEPSIIELAALFRAELEGVAFPDVDASSLADAIAALQARSAEVEQRREALREAVAALEADQDALRKQARRALAYARVFAADDAELLARLDALELDQAPAAPRKRTGATRGRPRRSADAPQLALGNDGSAAPARPVPLREPAVARAAAE